MFYSSMKEGLTLLIMGFTSYFSTFSSCYMGLDVWGGAQVEWVLINPRHQSDEAAAPES